MSTGVKFLQLSDLHLGGRSFPGCFEIDAQKTTLRNKELVDSLKKLPTLAKEVEAEIILIPGDLFDRESADANIINTACKEFADLPPVFITPGNHDYLSANSPYSHSERTRRGLEFWPENVYIFESFDFSTRYLPGRPEVAITGSAFRSNAQLSEHQLANKIPRDPAEISILLLHGSRTQFALEESQKITLPFTATELLKQNFSYTALGHYHTYSEINDGAGNLRAVYGGRPFGSEFLSGNAGCISGVITHQGASEIKVHSLDERKLLDITVYCQNVSSNKELTDLALNAFSDNGGSKNDLVRFNFTGTHSPEYRPRVEIDPNLCFASTASFAELRSGYDLKSLLQAAESSAPSAECLFAKKINDMIINTDSATERRMLNDALDYGLKAINNLPIKAREIS